MALRSVVLLLALALGPGALAQERGLYLGADVGTGEALGETLGVPHVSIGYASRGGGLQAELGAELVGQVRRRYPGGPGDRMKRHGRLSATIAYGLPVSERVLLDAGLHARLSLAATITRCGGTDDCAAYDGYAGVGPALGATVSFGRVGVRAAGGYAQSSVGEVFDGLWARLGLRYRP
jgi:hypothetical protein